MWLMATLLDSRGVCVCQNQVSTEVCWSQLCGQSQLCLAIFVFGASQVVLVVKNLAASAGDINTQFDPWVGKIPWRRKWQPTPVFLPGKSHGQRSLAVYRLCRVEHDWSNLASIFALLVFWMLWQLLYTYVYIINFKIKIIVEVIKIIADTWWVITIYQVFSSACCIPCLFYSHIMIPWVYRYDETEALRS